MYDYLKGILISKQTTSYRGSNIVLDVNDIGYFICTSPSTIQKLPEINSTIKLFVSLSHKEDSMNLVGFLTKEERDVFNILLTVSGVGIKSALLILDEFEIQDLISVVIKDDYKEFSRTKGIGIKTAQKIIIELKDKLLNWSNITPISLSDVNSNNNISDDFIIDAQNVLLSLGYSINETKDAIKHTLNSTKDIKSSEDVLKYTLEHLAKIS